MNPTRRTLIVGGAAAALILPTASFASLKNGWQYVGAKKFAHSLGEAITRLPEALQRMKFPHTLEDVRAVMTAHPTGMHPGSTLKFGDEPLLAMVSGGGEVDFNVSLNFQPLAPGLQPPIINTMEWDIGDDTLILPEICFNWCYRRKAVVPVAAAAPPSCNCCVEVRYKLPAGMKHVSYAVFGPYPLDLASCGHMGQWDRGCVEHRCFESAEDKVIKWEREKKGVFIDDHWRRDGSYPFPNATEETLHAIWLPHYVVNGFGLIVCADSGDSVNGGQPTQAMKFSYMAWKDPYTRERMWHMDPFELFQG